MAWTAPKTWSVGELATAALINTHLRDNLLALHSDAWLLVGSGSGGAPGWLNSWGNLGGAYETVRFRRDGDGRVTIAGVAANASAIGSAHAMFTLNVGYRPLKDHIFICSQQQGGGPTYMDIIVRANGNIEHPVTGAATAYQSLDGISFFTD